MSRSKASVGGVHHITMVSLRGDGRLSRSYLAVRHLLRQLEIKREKGLRSQIIPTWFSSFVDDISERFEPFSGVARVGYECAFSDGVWEISIFLGETEMIGGADDGRLMPVNFRFDLTSITRHFDQIESLHWNAFPNSPVEEAQDKDLSFLTINGTVQSDTVMLQIHSTPPSPVGPAIRMHADGRMELT